MPPCSCDSSFGWRPLCWSVSNAVNVRGCFVELTYAGSKGGCHCLDLLRRIIGSTKHIADLVLAQLPK